MPFEGQGGWEMRLREKEGWRIHEFVRLDKDEWPWLGQPRRVCRWRDLFCILLQGYILTQAIFHVEHMVAAAFCASLSFVVGFVSVLVTTFEFCVYWFFQHSLVRRYFL